MSESTKRGRALWSIALSVLSAAAALGASTSSPIEPLRAKIEQTQALLKTHAAAVRARTGFGEQLHARLLADAGLLSEAVRPSWATDDEFWSYNAALVDLDVALVREATAGTQLGLPLVRAGYGGAGFLPPLTSADAAQPVAVYASAHYAPSAPAPLIVLLHGGSQTETQLLSFDQLRRLADDTGAVLVAPWAHGESSAFDAAYQADVDRVVDAARATYSIDQHRIYLCGVSAGAFGAFHAALANPKRWAGILAIGGSLGADDTPQVAAFKDKKIYVVAGLQDTIISNAFIRKTLSFMRGSGVRVAYYEEPLGEHSLHSLLPSISRAWHDMLAGTSPAFDATQAPAPARSATPAPPPPAATAAPAPSPLKTQAP